MKKRISLFWRVTSLRLKRLPTSGIEARPGVRCRVSPSVSANTPPITVVPPSGTSTSVCMRWVSIPGTPPTAIPVLIVLFSMVTRRMTVPASVICGVIERRKGTETKVVVTTAVPAAACVVWTGICEPLSICAGRLFKAVTRGVATVFASPRVSAKLSNALICALPNSPVVRPITVLAAAAPREFNG